MLPSLGRPVAAQPAPGSGAEPDVVAVNGRVLTTNRTVVGGRTVHGA